MLLCLGVMLKRIFSMFYFEFFVFNCLLPFPSLKLAIAQNQIIGYNNSISLHHRNHSLQGQSKSTPFRAIVSHHNHFHEFNSSNGNLSVPTTVVSRGVPSSIMNYYTKTKNNNSRNSNSSSSSSNSSKPLVIQLPGADKSQEKQKDHINNQTRPSPPSHYLSSSIPPKSAIDDCYSNRSDLIRWNRYCFVNESYIQTYIVVKFWNMWTVSVYHMYRS